MAIGQPVYFDRPTKKRSADDSVVGNPHLFSFGQQLNIWTKDEESMEVSEQRNCTGYLLGTTSLVSGTLCNRNVQLLVLVGLVATACQLALAI